MQHQEGKWHNRLFIYTARVFRLILQTVTIVCDEVS